MAGYRRIAVLETWRNQTSWRPSQHFYHRCNRGCRTCTTGFAIASACVPRYNSAASNSCISPAEEQCSSIYNARHGLTPWAYQLAWLYLPRLLRWQTTTSFHRWKEHSNAQMTADGAQHIGLTLKNQNISLSTSTEWIRTNSNRFNCHHKRTAL